MRKKIIAGNWKMNLCLDKGSELAGKINSFLKENPDKEKCIILSVPFTHIYRISCETDKSLINIAAQNCSTEEFGAYTGEVSVDMIKSAGASHVIIGHSERRQIFGETDEIIARKVQTAIKNELIPILCCGESLNERNDNKQFDIVKRQLQAVFDIIPSINIDSLIIAYEPVWAIGTGLNASPEQAQEMHKYIRALVREKYGIISAQEIPILYGGSMKPDNAKGLISQDDIDGGLIGGASLKAEDFIGIIKQS